MIWIFRILGSLPYIIGIYVMGAILMILGTYFVVSIYSFCVWDWCYVNNLWEWLHPGTNLMVRIGAIIGLVLSIIGGVLTKEING